MRAVDSQLPRATLVSWPRFREIQILVRFKKSGLNSSDTFIVLHAGPVINPDDRYTLDIVKHLEGGFQQKYSGRRELQSTQSNTPSSSPGEQSTPAPQKQIGESPGCKSRLEPIN